MHFLLYIFFILMMGFPLVAASYYANVAMEKLKSILLLDYHVLSNERMF